MFRSRPSACRSAPRGLTCVSQQEDKTPSKWDNCGVPASEFTIARACANLYKAGGARSGCKVNWTGAKPNRNCTGGDGPASYDHPWSEFCAFVGAICLTRIVRNKVEWSEPVGVQAARSGVGSGMLNRI
jgi:hypothetical protein